MPNPASPRHGTFVSASVTAMASHPPKPGEQTTTRVVPPPIPTDTSPQSRHHSRSLPTTPSNHAMASRRRSPSLGRTLNNASPRSTHSDSSQSAPATRKVHSGCRYETGMARARRRVPYSLGPDKLGPDPTRSRKRLASEEEQTVARDMQDLYHRLLPSPDSEQRRARLVQKLERILCIKWPDASIKVNVFGSTGNSLGTSDSDVDICITTDSKDLSRVCSIAELLATNGMERVVCVSSAKVPIVKVWDPELQVACDLNVNNPIALENTALIKSYIEIDSRVRPLAMIIKHWAKRRILNDAALGGTLSSYTWICLTLNFLQTRDPPIIPALQRSELPPRLIGGVNVAFDRDLHNYKDFGAANKSSLGELLYQFFRFYAFELDFETKVMSVRQGRLIPKFEKGWHLLQDNRLCVEEPFNVSRNLANTADDTSMKGIHLELRRAFALVADGHLEKCCEQYIYPPDEPKSSEHFVPPIARPVIPQPPHTLRGGKFGGRGSRNATHLNRPHLAGRRSSNPATRTQTPMLLRNLPFQMTTQELQLQAQHQQHLLHDQLYQQFQYLQAQEQALRARLNQQSQRSMLSHAPYTSYPFGHRSQDENAEGSSTNGVGSVTRGPLSAPLYQHQFASSPFLHPALPVTGIVTNPSSPHLSPATPDTRRFSRRTSVAQSLGGGSLRAHSQPARGFAAPLGYGRLQNSTEMGDYLAGRRSSASSTSHELAGFSNPSLNGSTSSYDANRRPAEYVGYYVGQSPSLLGYPNSASISPIPSHAGLAIQNGGLSPKLETNTLPVNGHLPESAVLESGLVDSENSPGIKDPGKPIAADTESTLSPKRGPLVVNGSVNLPRRRRESAMPAPEPEEHTTFSASTSEDLAFDTPTSSDEHSQDAGERECPSIGPLSGKQPLAVSLNGVHGKSPRRSPVIGGDESHRSRDAAIEPQVKPTLLPWSLGRQLSAVEEVRTPSPSLESRYGIPISPTRAKMEALHAKSRQGDMQKADADGVALSPRANGVSPTGVVVEGSSGATQSSWQTQKKKKSRKKTVKSENDAKGTNDSGGDSMPADESERKGG